MTAATPPIRAIGELFRQDCTALWATTFNVDLAFFNEYLLRRLGDPPLNAVVLADQQCLDESLERAADRPGVLAPVNHRFLLRGARIGSGRFHPKSYLSVAGRRATLLVGSGNLSPNGVDLGREVFVRFQSGTPAGDAAIATWRGWIGRLVTSLDDTRLGERLADLETRLPESTKVATVDSPLLHNLDAPLSRQFIDAIAGEQIEELLVTAPFYDEHGEALCNLVESLKPANVTIFKTSSTSVTGAALTNRLKALGVSVAVWSYVPDAFTHAKLVGAVAASRAWILSGSANLSHAALTRSAGVGNVELAVLRESAPNVVRSLFVPWEASTEPSDLDELATLTYRASDDSPAAFPARLLRASLRADGRLDVNVSVTLPATWQLAGAHAAVALASDGTTAVTNDRIAGPLVRLVDDIANPVSNWCVVEDPSALGQALREPNAVRQSGRPVELTAADLDTPLGRALLLMHRDMVMDVSERAPMAGAGELNENEAAAGEGDDNLWQRLERETLGRDPRVASYTRLFTQSATPLTLDEAIVDLLEAMRDRVPSDTARQHRTLLQLLVAAPEPERTRGSVAWSESARIRVRARNVLRRWAAAQTDRRLDFIDPYAPLVNLLLISSVFLTLWPGALGRLDAPAELEADDLDDLWARWFQPFVGTGNNDGWLDRADLDPERVRAAITEQLSENVTALCWLAIRPGPDRRDRIVVWQPSLRAAFDKGLINDTPTIADFLAKVTGTPVTADRVASDLVDALGFIDDDLWCARQVNDLGLGSLGLDVMSPGQAVQVRLNVSGVTEPLLDPRLPLLVSAACRYRHTSGVALYATDARWRLVFEDGKPAAFVPRDGAEMFDSDPIPTLRLDELTASRGVFADLFPFAARAA